MKEFRKLILDEPDESAQKGLDFNKLHPLIQAYIGVVVVSGLLAATLALPLLNKVNINSAGQLKSS